MDTYTATLHHLQTPQGVSAFEALYGSGDGVLSRQLTRYISLVKAHMDLFSAHAPLYLFSAPGRTEITGNHTDHQNGRVMCAAVDLDTIAAVSPRQDLKVNLQSVGYKMLNMDLSSLAPVREEAGTTAALIRGVAAGLKSIGRNVCGFDAMVMSDVMSGSGLSSSAAFEVLICQIMDTLTQSEAPVDPVTRAKISQYAENEFFMKPSGLMDQMACSLGGLSVIDFKQPEPQISTLSYDFEKKGYHLAVVDTRGSHDHLTHAYAAIREEMTAVARYFGESVLRRVRKEQVLMDLGGLRKQAGDRAILRALHFFNENERVSRAYECLQQDDLRGFFDVINASGESSWTLLQNTFADEREQPLCLALALAGEMLKGCGAWRVHGGGFAGTTLNFVPAGMMSAFTARMESAFGAGCCYALNVRSAGPVCLHQENA